MEFFVLNGMKFSTNDPAAERKQPDGSFIISPNHRRERCADFDMYGKLLQQFPRECGGGRFVRFHLSSGKFPQAAQVFSLRAQAG